MTKDYWVNLGMWDNVEEDSPSREEGVQKIIDKVEELGMAKVGFDYEGRTKHQSVAYKVARLLPKHYRVEIGYNYDFKVYGE